MEDAPYQVSLVNDGYYTFDGEGIKFVSPYVYSDFDIVSDGGEIFAVNNILDKIIKCQINPEYRPILKKNGFLMRDSREVERKKPGQPGARRKFQFSKR